MNSFDFDLSDKVSVYNVHDEAGVGHDSRFASLLM